MVAPSLDATSGVSELMVQAASTTAAARLRAADRQVRIRRCIWLSPSCDAPPRSMRIEWLAALLSALRQALARQLADFAQFGDGGFKVRHLALQQLQPAVDLV